MAYSIFVLQFSHDVPTRMTDSGLYTWVSIQGARGAALHGVRTHVFQVESCRGCFCQVCIFVLKQSPYLELSEEMVSMY